MDLGCPFLLYVAYRLTLEARISGEWWLPIITLSLAIGAILFKPSELVIDETGITEVHLLGLKRKMIPWKGASAIFVPGLREVLVIGSNGTAIKHSTYHIGQSEFLFELHRHKVFVQS